jgi:cytoskeletal protein RodZ
MDGIGEQLRAAREAKGLSLSQAASGTRIKLQHLESIEQDDFSTIAAAAYARGFIKIYAEFLGLDPEPLLRIYMERHAPIELRPALSGDEVFLRRRQSQPEEPDAVSDEDEHQPAKRPSRPVRRFDLGRLRPVLIAIGGGGLVLGVIVLAGVAILGRNRPPAGEPIPPLVIQNPPDPYLAVAAPEEPPP